MGTGDDRLLRTWAEAGTWSPRRRSRSARDDAPAGEWAIELPKLPGDMSFVMDQVLRLSADPASPLPGMVNPGKIGVAGHSVGGMTALSVAGNTCCHDGRIKAAVVLAGRDTPGSGQYWSRIITPMLRPRGSC